MLPNLFDVEGKTLVPSTLCYSVPWLKKIIDLYPKDYIQIYKYICWMTCMDASVNPYVNVDEESREETILSDLAPLAFSLDDPIIQEVLERCAQLYETPTLRIWRGAKIMLDQMASTLSEKMLTFGKEGNATDIRGMMKEVPTYTENFMKLETMLKEEQAKVKGDRAIPLWQSHNYKDTKEYERE